MVGAGATAALILGADLQALEPAKSAVLGTATRPVPTPNRTFAFDIRALGLLIGRHRISIEGADDAFAVHHQIFAEVAPLGITLYVFEHESVERFVDGRLVAINGRTRDGDSRFVVEGEAIGDEFEVRGRKGTFRAPADVMVGSFWTPAVLAREYLIEPKRGRVKRHVIHETMRMTETIAGDTRSFTRYRVSGILRGHVDYGDDQQWFGGVFKSQGVDVTYLLRS